MSRYGQQEPLLHPIEQLAMNCVISAVVAGVIWGIGNSVYDQNWSGKAYGAIFALCLLACYGIWVLFIRDNSGSGDSHSGGGGGSWLDDL